MDVNKILYDAIGASFEVYNALGPGLLESVYEKAVGLLVNFDVSDFKNGYKVIK